MSNEFAVQSNLRIHTCAKCGILFAMPTAWLSSYPYRDYFCPCGHRQHHNPPEPEPPTIEERQQQILELHEQEQAEARAAQFKQCPCCGKSYRQEKALQKHVARCEQLTHEKAA